MGQDYCKDREWESKTITRAEPVEDGFALTFHDGWSLFCPATDRDGEPVLPMAGDTARLFGQGIGAPVRGLEIMDRVIWYRSPEEQEEWLAAERDRLSAEITERQAETEKAIERAGVPAEHEMREADVPWPKTPEELASYIATLVDRPHDYGTCVYAMSMAAVAAFNYVAGTLGTTGFQASCADMDILRRTRGWKWGKILDYDNLLYPQYMKNGEHFPGPSRIIHENVEEFAKRAREKLSETETAHPDVVAHWRWLASLSPAAEEAAEDSVPVPAGGAS